MLHERTTVLAGHDESAFDLSALDQTCGDGQGVEEAETGVGDVENLRARGQTDLAVGKRRGGRLHHVAAHRAVDEEFYLLGAQSGFGERGFAGGGAGVGGTRALRPHTALANTGHKFEPAKGKFQAFIERTQAFLDIRRGEDFVGQRDGQRLDASVGEAHQAFVGESMRMERRTISLSKKLLPRPASTVTVVALSPLLRSLRRNTAALATSCVARLRLRNVSFSA